MLEVDVKLFKAISLLAEVADYFSKIAGRELKRIDEIKLRKDLNSEAATEAETRKKILDVTLEIQRTTQEIEKRIYEITDRIREWLFTVNSKVEDLKVIREELLKLNEEYGNKLDELRRKLDEISAAMSIKVKVPRKRKEETWIWR